MSSAIELKPEFETFEETPESRPYVHMNGCGETTHINGDAFERLCNPMYYTSGTICAACNQAFPFTDFVWMDTGETLEAYRERLWQGLPREQMVKAKNVRKLMMMGVAVVPIAICSAIWNFFKLEGKADWVVILGLVLAAAGVVTYMLKVPAPRIDLRKYV